jgi:hypothetical protein
MVPCFRQKKNELHKVDRISLFRFPELAALGGEGTDIMRRIKRRAAKVRKSPGWPTYPQPEKI